MKTEKLKIKNRKGNTLSATLEFPTNQKAVHYAIFAHCFTCSSSLSAVRHISRALTSHGFGVLRFDFTGLGKSEGDFTDSHFGGDTKPTGCTEKSSGCKSSQIFSVCFLTSKNLCCIIGVVVSISKLLIG